MWVARLRLKCDGTSAETRFRLYAKLTSPFKSAGASIQLTTSSLGFRISVSNAGYTMFRGSVKSNGYPLHSPVSPSLLLPCVTVCHHISTELYLEDYRAGVGMWAARTSWATRKMWRTLRGNGRVMFGLWTMILCATALAVLVIIGGVEKYPGPGVKVEKIWQILCSGYDINLKSELRVTRADASFITAVVMLAL